jgi:hypothetical protein
LCGVGILLACKIGVEFDTQEVTSEEGCLGQEVAQLRKDKRKMVPNFEPNQKEKRQMACKRLNKP